MSSPSLGYTVPNLPTTITSALDVSHSSVRRRVSGSHPGPGGQSTLTEPSKVTDGTERYENPFDDAHKVVPQQKLPALGRELFSDDEDGGVAHAPPIAAQDQDRPLPPIAIDASKSNCPSPRAQGETVTRLPTPNFAAIDSKSDGRTKNTDYMFGLPSKFTRPFRTLMTHSGLGASGDMRVDNSEALTGAGYPTTTLEEHGAKTTDATENWISGTDQALELPNSRILHQDVDTGGQTQASNVSAPLDTTIRLVHSSPSPSPSKDSHNGYAVEYDEESTEGLLRRRRPPHSPTLLAAIHGVTDRFTRRFPVSMSYRKADGREGGADDQHLLALLGYGETGAIVEWPNAWTPEKWSLLFSVCSVFIYGLAGLLLVLMTWFGVLHQSIITRIIDYDILVSYSAYRRAAFALPNKLDQAWSQKWGDEDRMILQYSFHCCGYWSPEHEATISPLCYPRTLLPGCKMRVLHFERVSLRRYYTWVFALVPLHVLNIVTAVLCSNHVNRLFGKGLTPWQYRLKIEDVRANALSVLKTYRDTLIPLLPNRVYALRSRQFGDGTSRSPRIPQEEGGAAFQATNGATGNGWDHPMPYEDSVESMFGFRGDRARRVDEESMRNE
ncbi:hypothetical protein FRC07_007049 [Ceratobasidium sp. 392]|nr:hypothetical protein FRC07_007049 [Ceratobasidium sp. 392]